MVLVSGVLFFTKTHNKTSHFFTFFSIFPLFVQKVRHFVKKSTFFCHFFNPHPHFYPKNKGAQKPPIQNHPHFKPQKQTQFKTNQIELLIESFPAKYLFKNGLF